MSSLLFVDKLVLFASSNNELQLLLGQFAAECVVTGMKNSTSNSEAMVLSWKRVDCPFQAGEEIQPQVEEFKYVRVLFLSEGW